METIPMPTPIPDPIPTPAPAPVKLEDPALAATKIYDRPLLPPQEPFHFNDAFDGQGEPDRPPLPRSAATPGSRSFWSAPCCAAARWPVGFSIPPGARLCAAGSSAPGRSPYRSPSAALTRPCAAAARSRRPSPSFTMRSPHLRLSVTPAAIVLGCCWLCLEPGGLFWPFLLGVACHEAGHLGSAASAGRPRHSAAHHGTGLHPGDRGHVLSRGGVLCGRRARPPACLSACCCRGCSPGRR